HGRKVGEVMATNPIIVGEDAELEEIIHPMEMHQITRVPVVNGRAVAEIAMRANLVQALAGLLRGSAPVSEDDASIRDKVREELDKLPRADSEVVTVTVKDGIVDLWGTFTAYRQDTAAVVAAENVPGVKEVKNH